jgi:hypothetical protein
MAETCLRQRTRDAIEAVKEESGYAIVVVIIESGENEHISKLISQLFATNSLDQWGAAGTVLILITAAEGWVIAEPSQKIEQKFLRPGALAKIHHIDHGSERGEVAVERRIHAVASPCCRACRLIVRQPGGIAPGMLYYSAVISFVVSALIGGLRPHWFTDKLRGRRPGEKIHAPFLGSG